MADIQFYHLNTPLERVLPKLLEKSYQGGFKTRVKMASEEKAEWMNGMLWTYNPDSFLPHGTSNDGDGANQPIYLTAANDNPNEANLMVVTDGSTAEMNDNVKRVLDIIDSADEQAVESARVRQQQYQAQGHAVSCVRQTATGWEKLSV